MSEKIRLVCADCNTINQFPVERLNEHPLCANCKTPLFSGTPIAVDNQSLHRHIQHSGIPVLIDFWAPWCGPCVSFAPTFAQFATTVGNQLRLLKVDTEANQQTSIDFNIRSIPTLALYRQGQEIGRVSGAFSLPQLQQWVVQQLTDPNH